MKKQVGSWLVAAILCVATPGFTDGDQMFTWEEVFADGPLPVGAELLPVTQGMDRMLRITGSEGMHTSVRLLTIDEPPVNSTVYAITGRITYTNVQGDGYLEMWNVFPDGGRYFSRTMGEPGTGDMAKITGTSPERPFVLPFNRTGVDVPPQRLEINVVLPGSGEVMVGPLTLKELGEASRMGSSRKVPMRVVWLVVTILILFGVLAMVLTGMRRRFGGDSIEERKMKSLDV